MRLYTGRNDSRRPLLHPWTLRPWLRSRGCPPLLRAYWPEVFLESEVTHIVLNEQNLENQVRWVLYRSTGLPKVCGSLHELLSGHQVLHTMISDLWDEDVPMKLACLDFELTWD